MDLDTINVSLEFFVRERKPAGHDALLANLATGQLPRRAANPPGTRVADPDLERRIWWAGASGLFVAVVALVVLITQPIPVAERAPTARHTDDRPDDRTDDRPDDRMDPQALRFSDLNNLLSHVVDFADRAGWRSHTVRTSGENRPAGLASDRAPERSPVRSVDVAPAASPAQAIPLRGEERDFIERPDPFGEPERATSGPSE